MSRSVAVVCLLLAAFVVLGEAREVKPVLINNSNTPQNVTNPKFCHKLDCPGYTIIYSNATANVEYRQYDAFLWARTNVSTTSFEVASEVGFNRLFDYISGANVGNVSIPMTAPVSIQVFPGQGPFCKSTFVVSFFVPYAEQTASGKVPPTPTSSDVYIELLPASTKAVYSFGGYTWTWKEVLPNIEFLYDYLIAHNQPFVPNVEYVCGYDAPFRPIDRHNEIWIDLIV
eukprot:TRINITY_DN1169_c0_g1_i2.p1 TRINITY_DN1169_c0_g1~~TRINITY_DN1169_c0_g1_i2.p1  ORF type:complete len:250 (+),score=122.56 TRINITY_DN1169_c0_g1_i2:64-750(+)